MTFNECVTGRANRSAHSSLLGARNGATSYQGRPLRGKMVNASFNTSSIALGGVAQNTLDELEMRDSRREARMQKVADEVRVPKYWHTFSL